MGLDTVSEAAVKARNESRTPQGDSLEPDQRGLQSVHPAFPTRTSAVTSRVFTFEIADLLG